jgi:hypothetical protein
MLVACNRQDSSSNDRSPATSQAWRPEPAAKTLGAVREKEPTARPIPNNTVDLLPQWFAEWKTAGITLTPDSFSAFSVTKVHAFKYEIDMNADAMVDRRPLLIVSPDSTKVLDPHDGLEMTMENGQPILVADDVGVPVAVIDLKTSSAFRILYCETSCAYDDAAWADANTFIVVGHYTLPPGDELNRGTTTLVVPALVVVSLDDSSQTFYTGPPVQLEAFRKSKVNTYLERKLESLFAD